MPPPCQLPRCAALSKPPAARPSPPAPPLPWQRVVQRRVLADDGRGNRTVEVDQTGAWRFLLFRGSFTVRMIVEQRAADRTVRALAAALAGGRATGQRSGGGGWGCVDCWPGCQRCSSRGVQLTVVLPSLSPTHPPTHIHTQQIAFRLARPGFMRQFGGTWRIAPYDNASLDSLVNRHRPSALHRLQVGLPAGAAGRACAQAEAPGASMRCCLAATAAAVAAGATEVGAAVSGCHAHTALPRRAPRPLRSTPQAGLRAVEQSLGLAGPQEASLVQLQQSIAPALTPPPALARVLQRIAAKQIAKIMTVCGSLPCC